MRLGGQRFGSSTSFADASTGEVVLQFTSSDQGTLQLAFCLYDSAGNSVAKADNMDQPTKGFSVEAIDGEVLLHIPADNHEGIRYRLYSRDGHLLTCSDGARTSIYPGLRMGGTQGRFVHSTVRRP